MKLKNIKQSGLVSLETITEFINSITFLLGWGGSRLIHLAIKIDSCSVKIVYHLIVIPESEV